MSIVNKIKIHYAIFENEIYFAEEKFSNQENKVGMQL